MTPDASVLAIEEDGLMVENVCLHFEGRIASAIEIAGRRE